MNFKKRFIFLNNINYENSLIYSLISYLPYVESIPKFETDYEKIQSSSLLTQEHKDYLHSYYDIKTKWNKGYVMNNYFTCGVSTIQRVESIHATMKSFSLKTSLQEILKVMKSKKYSYDKNDFNEKNNFLKPIQSKAYDNVELIKYFKTKISSFIIEKIKIQFELSLNYNMKVSYDKW